MRESQPSPPWGRGWPAAGVFISRGRTGEGVKTVTAPRPCRQCMGSRTRRGAMEDATRT